MGLTLVIKMAQRVHNLIIAAVLASGGTLLAQPLPGRSPSAVSDNLPALGEAAVEELSPVAERRLGRAIFHELVRAGVVYDDPEATDYLTIQSNRLLDVAREQGHLRASALDLSTFQFFMVNDPSINAFALPGGFVGVHTGLIVQASTEAELMSVMAHEIGHVTQRHIARMFGQQRQSTAVFAAAAILAALAATKSPDAATGLLSLGQTLAVRDQLAFSRDAEREADRVGFSLLVSSGFDGHGMSSLFERLLQSAKFMDSNAPSWMRTHPLTSERINDITLRLNQLPSTAPVRAQSIEFGWVRQRLTIRGARSMDGLARQRALLQEELSRLPATDHAQRARASYGMAWAFCEERKAAEAALWLQSARMEAQQWGQLAVVEPMLMRLEQELAILERKPARAVQIAERATQVAPRSVSTRAILRAGTEAALQDARADWALITSKDLVRRWPEDREAWRLLSQSASAQGQRAYSHWAVAERYALSGAWRAAIEQLDLARKAGDGDFALLSQVDVRMSVMRAEMAREAIEAKQR